MISAVIPRILCTGSLQKLAAASHLKSMFWLPIPWLVGVLEGLRVRGIPRNEIDGNFINHLWIELFLTPSILFNWGLFLKKSSGCILTINQHFPFTLLIIGPLSVVHWLCIDQQTLSEKSFLGRHNTWHNDSSLVSKVKVLFLVLVLVFNFN